MFIFEEYGSLNIILGKEVSAGQLVKDKIQEKNCKQTKKRRENLLIPTRFIIKFELPF